MKIEFIYTFNNDKEQRILRTDCTKSNLKSQLSLEKFAFKEYKEVFSDDEDFDTTILKISCQIQVASIDLFVCPKWYTKCNGKLWFEKNRLT